MSARDTFAARFGEDQAQAVEQAGRSHLDQQSMLGGIHDDDDRGSDEFRYWFLAAIGYECVTRYRDCHGITADPDEMKDWARGEGALREHDGDIPDYLTALVGRYDDWLHDVGPDEARRLTGGAR